MSTRTEYALENIEPGPFEKLAIDILTRNRSRHSLRGIEIHEADFLLDLPAGASHHGRYSIL